MDKIKSKVSEKDKCMIKNIIGAFLVKGFALIVSLMTVPGYINYFDNNIVLGVWYTILSIISWVITFDLGIGNGLRNHLVIAFVEKNDNEAKKYISCAYFSVGFVCLALMGIMYFAFPFIPWNDVLNVDADIISLNTLIKAMRIVGIGITLQLFLKLITSVLYALQKSALINFVNLLSNFLILVYVKFAVGGTIEEKIFRMSWFNVVAVNAPMLVITLLVFIFKLKNCRPNFKYCNKKYTNNILKLGGAFFGVQILYMIIINTNEFFISWLSGPEFVVEFQIYNKIFTMLGIVTMLVLTPVWSMVTKAMTENDYRWLKKINRMLYLMAVIATIGEFLLVPFGDILLKLWVGDADIIYNTKIAFVFAIFGSLMIWNGVLSSVANGLGKPQIQALVFSIGAIIKYPLAKFLVNSTGSWCSIMMVTTIPLFFYTISQVVYNHFYINKKLQQ